MSTTPSPDRWRPWEPRCPWQADRCFDHGGGDRAFDELIAPGVDAVICNHVSNVFGFVQPVEEVAALCRSRGVPLIVDASQSAGILPLDMKSLGAAYIAMPGHKGLYGPQGTGVLLVRGRSDARDRCWRAARGVFLSVRRCRTSCRTGWRPGPTICRGSQACWRAFALSADRGRQAILRHEHALTRRTAESLRRLPGVEVFAHRRMCWPRREWCPSGCRGRDAETVGEALARAGDRGAGGAALRAAGPPHRRDAGHRHGPGQLFRLQHASGGGPAGGGRGRYSPEIRPERQDRLSPECAPGFFLF